MARYVASSLLAACWLFGLTEQAGAVEIGQILATASAPQAAGWSAPAFAMPNSSSCEAATAPTAIASIAFGPAPSPLSAQVSKASAILGGVSALDRIRFDQTAQTASAPASLATTAGLEAGIPGAGLSPSAGPLVIPSVAGTACGSFALPRAAIAVAPGRRSPIAGGDDFLQTRRLAVSHTAFDSQWARVSRKSISPRILARQAGLNRLIRGGADLAAVKAVNAWTNRRVRFTEDAKLFGTADYWASAQTTLKLGAGDCEDIAITKMQLLAAAGVPRSDMYLTIARDLARHADHALLIVRMDGRYWLLDNSTDQVLDAQASYDYQPVLSFSEGRKWLHGAVVALAD